MLERKKLMRLDAWFILLGICEVSPVEVKTP